LLVQEVASQYAGRVTFVSENFGASALADRFGVKGYPAVFVDDILVAAPREFGYFGEVEGAGRYAPWRNEANQAKFKSDLTRMIDLILAGRKDIVGAEHSNTSRATRELAALPAFKLTDLAGKPLSNDQLANRVVLVEFWATWCPPCRSTLQWLGELQRRHSDKLAVVALAVESPEDQIRSVAALTPDLRSAITDPVTAQAFGDITAVPTLFLFDRSGKTAGVLYGAPPDLHDQVEKQLESLLK
jgi:cytochrome c biogenesis protein CcmG/thiol:disulfide interchange protein DsbE